MKKKIVVLAGLVAAAWGVKQLVSRERDAGDASEQPQAPEERLAA